MPLLCSVLLLLLVFTSQLLVLHHSIGRVSLVDLRAPPTNLFVHSYFAGNMVISTLASSKKGYAHVQAKESTMYIVIVHTFIGAEPHKETKGEHKQPKYICLLSLHQLAPCTYRNDCYRHSYA